MKTILDYKTTTELIEYLLSGLRLELKRCKATEDGYANAWCHILDLMLNNVNFREHLSYLSFCHYYFISEIATLSKKQQLSLWMHYCDLNSAENEFDISLEKYEAMRFEDLPQNFMNTIAEGLWSNFVYYDCYEIDQEIEDANNYRLYQEIPKVEIKDLFPFLYFQFNIC